MELVLDTFSPNGENHEKVENFIEVIKIRL